jgi:hypothetical protein
MTGSLSPSAEVYITVGIPLMNLQSLQYLTQEISTPGSPMYRSFLTPAEVAQEFLPIAQYQQALSFLQARGFSIVLGSLDSIIVAEGTAAEASSSLGLSFSVYSDGNSSYYTASGTSPLAGAYLYSSNVTAVLLGHPPTLVTESTISSLASRGPSQSNQTAPDEAYPLTDLANAYNVTSLYSKGITGTGYTAGILDFYGDPYIAQQLQYFDELYGLPSTHLQVIPLGPYDPSLGPVTGWDGEISLDVESVRSLAPGASIDLYIANGAFPIAAAVAPIVQDDKVNDLSQSFGYPDSVMSQLGASGLALNVVLADQYYLLGSAEGITFTAASGDRGGTGDSGGPEGTPLYPADSPYVVAVGGTTTFVDFSGSTVSSSYQTAWSNYGFVPDGANYGGATSGVSILEPRPWYQSSLQSPSGFADGRIIPDVSLNASPYPGIIAVFAGNVTGITGGTSESSPLLAGLLTLLMQSSKSSLGLINPSLYALGQSKTLNPKVYTPVTFGYNIPWVASSGYNLLTGWGAPNIGEMAQNGLGAASGTSLGVNVSATAVGGAPEFEFNPGQTIAVGAIIKTGALLVTSGTFSADLQTLAGAGTSVPLTYNAKTGAWTGEVTAPTNSSGLSYLTVSGTFAGTSGVGFTEIFAGYVATYFSPATDTSNLSPIAYSSEYGIPVDVNITTLDGVPVTSGTFGATLSSYSISTNTYKSTGSIRLSYGSTAFGLMWGGIINGSYPNGPVLLSTDNGAYGYLPFINGVGLEATIVEGSVLSEPGVVAPGQSLFVVAGLQAPLNLPNVISLETGAPVSFDVELGSNVTATLVNQAGAPVATAQLYANEWLTTTLAIQGYIQIPSGLTPGLYTLMLTSQFNSFTLSASVDGSYFEQIYVAPSSSVPKISMAPGLLFEGESATVNAKITYANGTNVKYGMYEATLYPNAIQNLYPVLTEDIQVPLWYNVATGVWSGNVTLPSAYNGGGTVTIDPGAIYLNGPYDIYVSGLSADGVPTTTDISAQHGFIVQPYLLVSGQTFASPPQTSGVAFSGDTITSSVSLAGDLFTGTNTIKGGSVTIVDSQINGTLNVDNAQLTLMGVSGGSIVAQNSKITLDQSSVSSLQLTGSQVSLNASSFAQVSPSLPSITVQSPAAGQTFSGSSGSLSVSGQDISTISVYLDGSLLTTLAGGSSSYTFPLGSSSLQDGVHILQVVAKQQDGLSTSDSVYFTTNGKLTTAENDIGTLNSQISSATSTISSLGSQLNSANGTIGGLSSKLSSDNSTISSLMNVVYVLAVIAVIALVVAIAALFRKGASSPRPSNATTTGTGSSSRPASGPESPSGSGTEPPSTGGTESPPQPSPQPQ